MNRENIKKDETISENATGKEAETNTEEQKTANINDCAECSCDENETRDGPDQEDEIIKLTKENETLKDLLQRRQADFENYKKRTAKLQEDYKKTAIKEFARDIIDINDDLIRAIEAAENLADPNAEDTQKYFSEGVAIISKRIVETLENYGIVEIEAEGKPFDPNFHEAIEIGEADENIDTDTVTRVHQKGFRLDELVIRTAKVKVAKAVKKNEETSGPCKMDQEPQ